MVVLKGIAYLALIVGVFWAFQPGEKKEVSVVQQYSPMMGEWHDVILVFGFMNNEAEAENVKAAFEKLSPNRTYRIAVTNIPSRDLKKYRLAQK
jgi:hypothetical protein